MALSHDYYVGGLGKGLSLEPTPGTAALMRRYDLLLRKEGTGYKVFFGTESWREQSSLSQIQAAIGLRFVLKTDNPYFLNITEIDFSGWGERRLYFHNLHPSPHGELFLSQNEKVDDLDLLPSVRLPYELMADLSNLPLTPIRQPQMSGSEVEDKTPQIGWTDFGVTPNDLGLVDIYIGRAGPMLRPPSAGPAPAPTVPPKYKVHFRARATRWRYLLIHQNGGLPELVQVLTDGKNKLEIEDEGQREVPAVNQTARVFSLKEAFALEERPTRRLKLHYTLPSDHTRPNAANITLELPMPDGRKISPQVFTSKTLMYSDIFVYV
jgi:hypothetical protein